MLVEYLRNSSAGLGGAGVNARLVDVLLLVELDFSNST